MVTRDEQARNRLSRELLGRLDLTKEESDFLYAFIKLGKKRSCSHRPRLHSAQINFDSGDKPLVHATFIMIYGGGPEHVKRSLRRYGIRPDSVSYEDPTPNVPSARYEARKGRVVALVV